MIVNEVAIFDDFPHAGVLDKLRASYETAQAVVTLSLRNFSKAGSLRPTRGCAPAMIAVFFAGPLQLLAKKKFGQKWQTRHCVIKSHYLFVFKSESDDTPKGIINLKGPSFKVVPVAKPLGFVLTGADGAEHVFKTASEEDAQSWIIALKLKKK